MDKGNIKININGKVLDLDTESDTKSGKRQETVVFQQPTMFGVDTIQQVITYDEQGNVLNIKSTNLSEVERQARKQEKKRELDEAWKNRPMWIKVLTWLFWIWFFIMFVIVVSLGHF